MTTVRDIEQYLYDWAPRELAESWDNVGLLVGDPEVEVRRVLVALDVTPQVVDEAIEKDCQLIAAHHPVMNCAWNQVQTVRTDDRQGRVLTELIRHGIAAICMHTNLDATEGGVNEVLAGIFGMRNWEPFAGGCGRVGEVDPIPVPELAKKAQDALGKRCNLPETGPAVQVKYTDSGRPVRRLAVISGAGGSLFEEAIAMGADCLLTGEANHHHACDAARLGLSLIAAGHYATEFPVTAAMAERLRAAFPELEVLVSTANRDPYTYI